jgi:hypothetical protein
MYGLIVNNNTNHKITIIGKSGTDWKVYDETEIAPGKRAIIAGLSWVPRLSTDHWGWIFFQLDDEKKTTGQFYMSAGSERGLFDYCVQPYDGGKNRNGDTMPLTGAESIGYEDGCSLTLFPGYPGN